MGEKKPTFCHLCGEKLQGSYVVYDNGLVVCKPCNDTVPHCNRCNLPSRQLTKARGTLICPACRQKAPICAFCHEPILSRYSTYNKALIVCEDCDVNLPHCSHCGLPSRQLTKARDTKICPDCRKKLPVCPCCHEPILGKAFTYDTSPIRYCESCVLTRPHCDICRVPLDDQGKAFPGKDGQAYRCASCLRSAVTKSDEAERLYRETYAILKRELQLEIPNLPKLNVVERAVLAGLNHQTGTLDGSDKPIGPESQHLLGFFKRVNDDRTIYIERLLPQTLFLAVAAHELAHAWQSFYAPSAQPLEIVEGFAEWVAYRVLLALGEQKDAARLTRRDDLYGKGLQYFIQIERQQGRQAVLQKARQH